MFLKILLKVFADVMVSLEQKKIREIWAFVNFAGSQFLSLLEERKKDSAQIAVETNGGIAIWMR